MVGLLSLRLGDSTASMPKSSAYGSNAFSGMSNGYDMPDSSESSFGNFSTADDVSDWLPSFSEPRCVLIYKEGRFTFEDGDLPSAYDPTNLPDQPIPAGIALAGMDTNFFQEGRCANTGASLGGRLQQAPPSLRRLLGDDSDASGTWARSSSSNGNLILGIKEKIKGVWLDKKKVGSSSSSSSQQEGRASSSGSSMSCSGTMLSCKHSEKASSQSASNNRTTLRRWSAKLRKASQ